MSLDSALRKAASSVLRKFGTPVVVQRVTLGGYNPATGKPASTITTANVRGRLDDYTDRELNNRIAAGDRKLTVAAADMNFEPATSDRVQVGSLVYEIIRVQRTL